MLRELKRDGLLERRQGRKVGLRGTLPPVAVVEVTGLDEDGELLARPAVWEDKAPPPVIYLAPERRSRAALAPGDRVLAKLSRIDADTYEGRPIRRIAKVPSKVLGVYEVGNAGGRLRPTDRRAKHDFVVRSADSGGARPGELVLADVPPGRPRLGLREARVVERLGHLGDPRTLSLIALYEHDIPIDFPDDAVAEAERVARAPKGKREDLRAVPLVTIDGADARDFDDAVWAEPDPDPANDGGWHLLIAIADVAWYVRPGGALDRAAFDRGNSVYFPDRVVPMLPEILSNGWCSLRPNEDRACLAAELWIDADGTIVRSRFLRGIMRSATRLTYDQVQAAHDGRPDETTGPLCDTVIAPLYGAYKALHRARTQRGTLDLDLPERQVLLAEDGTVAAIAPRARHDSHRLIEEFMIAANVAAAHQLETLDQPCMYRVHDQPDPVKIEALRQILDSLGLSLARGQVVRPKVLTRVLDQVRGNPSAPMVNELILRAQSQANYSPDNVGHFGLALTHYAHFTSPIRRYADLLVHRALITGLRLGEGDLPAETAVRFTEIGDHISTTERRAAAAERDAVDRFTASFLEDKVGAIVRATINGVTRFGLFATLDETGADGLVPMSLLPDDRYDHVEPDHCLVGRRWGRVYRLGERISARLREVNPVTGGIVLELVEPEDDDHTADGPEPAAARGWHPLDQGRGGTAKGAKRGRRGKARPGPGRRNKRTR